MQRQTREQAGRHQFRPAAAAAIFKSTATQSFAPASGPLGFGPVHSAGHCSALTTGGEGPAAPSSCPSDSSFGQSRAARAPPGRPSGRVEHGRAFVAPAAIAPRSLVSAPATRSQEAKLAGRPAVWPCLAWLESSALARLGSAQPSLAQSIRAQDWLTGMGQFRALSLSLSLSLARSLLALKLANNRAAGPGRCLLARSPTGRLAGSPRSSEGGQAARPGPARAGGRCARPASEAQPLASRDFRRTIHALGLWWVRRGGGGGGAAAAAGEKGRPRRQLGECAQSAPALSLGPKHARRPR